MRKFGLIGYPLGHSFSKKFFAEKFIEERVKDAVYDNYPIERIDRLPDLLASTPELLGFNCTIPYKMEVMPYLDHIDPAAKKVGAVNTVKIDRSSGKPVLTGYNTDVFGFEESLKPDLSSFHNKALVLGTGGAARAVVYVLEKIGIAYTYVSRSKGRDNTLCYSEVDAEVLATHKLIINTSPLGMHPDTETAPAIPYQAITKQHYLYDLVYNPEITKFLNYGIQHEALVKNGLEMLHLQAERAWDIWNDPA